jgi:AMP-binding enzyme
MARYFIEIGVKPGDRVAVLLDRGSEAYAALLALMKARATYVPLDANLPNASATSCATHPRRSSSPTLGSPTASRIARFAFSSSTGRGRRSPQRTTRLCAVTATLGHMTPDRPVAIGRPLPTYSIVVLDPVSDEALPLGETGESALPRAT